MRGALEASGVALAGLVTSILTAALVTAVDQLLGFNLFTFSLWLLVPVGAGLCGFLAASGYYAGAKALHQRPRSMLLVQMVVIAAFTQALIYWLEYATTVVDGVPISSLIGFVDYMDVVLTRTHVRLGRMPALESSEVGAFGYVLAGLQFIGFLLGGACVYLVLRDQPSCAGCNKYLRTLATRKGSFDDTGAFAAYYDNEFEHPVDSAEFAEHVSQANAAGKPGYGSVKLVSKVLGCPSCQHQAVSEKVQIHNGREWKAAEGLNRFVPIPPGIDVAPLYR